MPLGELTSQNEQPGKISLEKLIGLIINGHVSAHDAIWGLTRGSWQKISAGLKKCDRGDRKATDPVWVTWLENH